MSPAYGPAVWRGSEQRARDWIVSLQDGDCDELIRAAQPLRGRPLEQLCQTDFRLGGLAPKLVTTADTLERGRGFAMLRGLPAAELPPDLLQLLYRGFHNSRRSHGIPTPSAPVPVFASGARGIECYFLPATVRQATEEGCAFSAADAEALAFVGEVADRPGLFLDMDFRVGDIQFLSNRTILHARTDYEDYPEAERKRHLLRLWLMMPAWPPRPAAMNFHERVDRAGGGVRPQSA